MLPISFVKKFKNNLRVSLVERKVATLAAAAFKIELIVSL